MVKWYALFGAAVLLATCVHAQDDSFDDIFAPLVRSEISLPTIIPLDSLFSAPRQESNPFVASSSLPRMTVRIIPITSEDDMEGGLRGMQAGARSGKTACVPCNMMRSFSSPLLDGSAMSQGPMGDMLDDLFSFHQGSSSSSIFSSLPRGGFKQTTIVDDGKTTKTTTITTDEKGTETHTTETRDSDGASRPNGLNSVMRFSTSGPTSPQRSMDISDLIDDFFGLPTQQAQAEQVEQPAQPAALQDDKDEVVPQEKDQDGDEDDIFEDLTKEAESDELDQPAAQNSAQEQQLEERAQDDGAVLDDALMVDDVDADEGDADDQDADQPEKDAADGDVQIESEDLDKLDKGTKDTVLQAVQDKLKEMKATSKEDKKDSDEAHKLEQEVTEVEQQAAELRKKMSDEKQRIESLKRKSSLKAASASIEASKLRDEASEDDKAAADAAQAAQSLQNLEDRMHDSIIA